MRKPNKPPDFSQHTYAEMSAVIMALRDEVSTRNPIGVNFYLRYFERAAGAMTEISQGEMYNFTSEHGPREPKARARKAAS